MIHVNAKWLPPGSVFSTQWEGCRISWKRSQSSPKIWFTLILTFLLPMHMPSRSHYLCETSILPKLVREIGVRDIWSKLLWNKTNPREMNFGSSYWNIPRISQPKCRHNWLQFLFCSQKSYWSSFSKLWVKLRNQGCEWSKKWLVKFTLIKRTEKYRHVQD